MDASVYALLALLAFCRVGGASSNFDTFVDNTGSESIQPNDEHLKRIEDSPNRRELIGAFPDQKFRHLGLGKRTLDFFRFHSKVGKRLDLLALIQNNLDKSQNILTGNTGSYLQERLPHSFGSRVTPLRKLFRDRKNALRLREKESIVQARGRRQKVDPYMYLIGVGK